MPDLPENIVTAPTGWLTPPVEGWEPLGWTDGGVVMAPLDTYISIDLASASAPVIASFERGATMVWHPREITWCGEVVPVVPWCGNGVHWPEVVAEIAREEMERQQEQTEEAA